MNNSQLDNERTLEIYFSHNNSSIFEKPEDIKYKYDIIRKILGRKTVCLRCHSLHVINYAECPDCGAKTIKYDSDVIKRLVHSSIKNLRVGIPGNKHQKHYYSMLGTFKEELQYRQEYFNENIYIGFREREDDYSQFYPVHIWDLERFHLIGVNLWNYLYYKDLGTFIGMRQVVKKNVIPIPRDALKDYIKFPYFVFMGYHQQSNKGLLVLSRYKSADIDNLNDLETLDMKIKKLDKAVEIDSSNPLCGEFKNAEWYLYFNSGENIIIIPQEKSKLDIRDVIELINLMELDSISRDYKIKYSWREWDMDEHELVTDN